MVCILQGLDSQSVNQRSCHVVHEIIICMPTHYEVEFGCKRPRHKDYSFVMLWNWNHRDITWKCTVRIECDSVDYAMSFGPLRLEVWTDLTTDCFHVTRWIPWLTLEKETLSWNTMMTPMMKMMEVQQGFFNLIIVQLQNHRVYNMK